MSWIKVFTLLPENTVVFFIFERNWDNVEKVKLNIILICDRGSWKKGNGLYDEIFTLFMKNFVDLWYYIFPLYKKIETSQF